ncbi:MAG: hypothetical protein ABRQ38_25530, partial [Candidatus Eremiobacterota bacterium]
MNEQKGQDKQLLKVSSLEEIRKSFKLRIEENKKELQTEKEQSVESRQADGQRNYQIFRSILDTFWAEGHLSDVQKNLIERKKIALAIPDDVAEKIEGEVKNKYCQKIENGYQKKENLSEIKKNKQNLKTLLYRTMLESTLVDGDFTEKETLYLRRKKIELDITDEEAASLETQVRTELKSEKTSAEKSLLPVNKITLHRHPRPEEHEDKKTEEISPENVKEETYKVTSEKSFIKPYTSLPEKEEIKNIEIKEECSGKSEEEAKKQALRLKWLAEEEALQKKDKNTSEEEAKKQSLRLKWVAEEEALKEQEGEKIKIQLPEEEAKKLEEEELARKAQEEFNRAQEEAKKLEEEELARKAQEE